MKRYFVITHKSFNDSHINVQDLLPASCKLITGIAVNATAKQEGEIEAITKLLPFPQMLIANLLNSEQITTLFYSYLHTRATEQASRAFFESDILPEIVRVLSSNIVYTCLDAGEQQVLTDSIINIFNAEFTDYIYNESNLFDVGQNMTDSVFADFIAQKTLIFIYINKERIFKHNVNKYIRPEPYECGNISLLVNGNSFLLRDYAVTANRKVRNIKNEIIPFHEALEVNSNIHTVFKSYQTNSNNTLTIRIYIEYEYK